MASYSALPPLSSFFSHTGILSSPLLFCDTEDDHHARSPARHSSGHPRHHGTLVCWLQHNGVLEFDARYARHSTVVERCQHTRSTTQADGTVLEGCGRCHTRGASRGLCQMGHAKCGGSRGSVSPMAWGNGHGRMRGHLSATRGTAPENLPGEKELLYFPSVPPSLSPLLSTSLRVVCLLTLTGIDLDMLCTHPEYRGRGAGSMLVAQGCKEADQDQVPAYVDASTDGAPLYARYGFQDRTIRDGTEAQDITSMVREPK